MITKINSDLLSYDQWLINKVKLNIRKTKLMYLFHGQNNANCDIKIENEQIERVKYNFNLNCDYVCKCLRKR